MKKTYFKNSAQKIITITITVLLLVTLSIFTIGCTSTNTAHLQEFNRQAQLFHGTHDIAFSATYYWRQLLNYDYHNATLPEEQKWQYVLGEVVFQRNNGVVSVSVWETVFGWREVQVLPAMDMQNSPRARTDAPTVIGDIEQNPYENMEIRFEQIQDSEKTRVTCEETIELRLAHFFYAVGGICEYCFHQGRTRGGGVEIETYFISSCATGRFMALHHCSTTTFNRQGSPIFDWENIRRNEFFGASITSNGDNLTTLNLTARSYASLLSDSGYTGFNTKEIGFSAVFTPL